MKPKSGDKNSSTKQDKRLRTVELPTILELPYPKWTYPAVYPVHWIQQSVEVMMMMMIMKQDSSVALGLVRHEKKIP
ncbi:jg5015 [Pararge aegeria aegeria]|uniref:Jg5015 protein n=1 Tax=Pararge aegeria aegeria TaxID=348720 RepID=A0A8S4RBI4_9NEOP|nr:jg5015 [Pararge aegeria aegeria]